MSHLDQAVPIGPIPGKLGDTNGAGQPLPICKPKRVPSRLAPQQLGDVPRPV
jgi:hypothetical protein